MVLDCRKASDRRRTCNVRAVLLDGEDVTKRCVKFDTRRGEVTLYRWSRDAVGMPQYTIENGSLVVDKYRGRVEVRW